jgi:nucleoside-diphosphate-sugar epimerase
VKILLTGATGFIGRNVLDHLQSEGHGIASLERPPKRTSAEIESYPIASELNPHAIGAAFESFSPDLVIHLAASWRKSQDVESLKHCYDANVNFPVQVITEAMKRNVRFINVCSYWQLSHPEFQDQRNLYVTTKNAFRLIADNLGELNPGKVTNVYLFDNYGPLDERGKVISTLVESAKKRLVTSLRSPDVNLNLLHVDDVARGIVKLAEEENLLPNYEISDSRNIHLGQCVAIIESQIGKLSINWFEKSEFRSDTKIHERIFPVPPGWAPQIALHEGVGSL